MAKYEGTSAILHLLELVAWAATILLVVFLFLSDMPEGLLARLVLALPSIIGCLAMAALVRIGIVFLELAAAVIAAAERADAGSGMGSGDP